MAQAQGEFPENGNTSSSEETKFRETYQRLVDKRLELTKGGEKDILAAVEQKRLGNKCYVNKEFKDALRHYNKGIRKCPQDSVQAREILCKLIGNRTAVNIELQCYNEVLSDIAYLTDIGNYPTELKFKMLYRQGLCYEALGDPRADETFDDSLNSLIRESDLKDAEFIEQIKLIDSHRKNGKRKVGEPSTSKHEIAEKIEEFKGSEKYPSASRLIDFAYDENQGRYAVARANIPIGTLILKEDPYVAAVDKERALDICQYCFACVEQLIACSTCSHVVFCSIACRNNAQQSFHGPECKIYATLIGRFDIMLVLRLITQNRYSFFAGQKDKLIRFLETDDQGLTKKGVYRSDDYENILALYRHIEKKEDERPYFEAAVYVLRVLKATSFFPFRTKQNVLLDEELFIGRLILTHCMVMSYNIHGINELTFLAQCNTDEEDKHFLNEGIGAGLFATLALFNHSCEASIIRYYNKKQVCVRTIKPVRAGDIVYDNYGPNYLFIQREKRRQKLKEDYHFECLCPPCVEHWPTAADTELIVIRIPCKTRNCGYVFHLTPTNNPSICELCKRPLAHSDVKASTEPIIFHYSIADKLFKAEKYDKCLEPFKAVLELKYRYSNQPDIELIRIQEKMAFIYSRHGNRAKHE